MGMSKTINSIGALIGLILVLIGILGPWFSFSANWRTYNETTQIYGKTSTKLSPFTMTCVVKVIATSSIIPNTRSQPIIPTKIPIMDTMRHFYDIFASFVGVSCIMSVMISFLGQYMDRRNVNLMGGIICVLSTLSLFLVIPKNVNLFDFIIMRNWYITLLGALFITLCSTFHEILVFIKDRVENLWI